MTTGGVATAPSRPPRPPYEWWERFLASDPGLNRLRTAGQAVASIGAAMAVEWLFIHLTGALQVRSIPAGSSATQAAAIAAANHAAVLMAMMIGAVVGMISAFIGPMFPRPSTLLVSMVLVPVPMVAGMAIGLALAPYHLLAVGSLVVVLALGAYLRRFGPRGFFGGQLLFMGDFFGFFLSRLVGIGDIGWLAAIVALGAAVAILAQFTLFFPSRRKALRRMRLSYAGRVARVADAAVDVLDDPGDERKVHRLHRQLVRLNESALMIDAQLADPAALPPGSTARSVHQRVFDSELTLTNTARFAIRLSTAALPAEIRQQVRAALVAVTQHLAEPAGVAAAAIRQWLKSGDAGSLPVTVRIVLHRFSTSVLAHVRVMRSIQDRAEAGEDAGEEAFDPAVQLFGGWLPGSSQVSATASNERGARWIDRVRLEPYARVTIQMAVAVTASIVVGSLIDPLRFYWAVIATFVTFLGAHNATEQIRKGALRVIGTLIGVLVGALLAHLIGGRTALSIVVVLAALFFGLYLLRISYALMTVGITVMISELYVQLNEFSIGLLMLRLGETAAGAGMAALTVLLVLPVRIRQVVAVASREHLQALVEVVGLAVERLRGDGDAADLRAAVRRLDAAFQALEAATRPLRGRLPGVSGGGLREQFWHAATASRHYARNLVIDTGWSAGLPQQAADDCADAGRLLAASVDEIIAVLEDPRMAAERSYVRSASLFDRIAVGLEDQDVTTPRQLAFRDLELIDGALATLAQSVRMRVEGLDTELSRDDRLRST